MSKPIFIVKLPNVFNNEQCDSIGKKMEERFFDYHILVVACEVKDFIFECYNTTDLDTKSFEELKELVKTYKTE